MDNNVKYTCLDCHNIVEKDYNSCASTFGTLTINDLVTTYEQVKLPINFEEVKNYYYQSNYYKAFPEWTNIILYVIKYGICYNSIFSKEYNSKISLKENYNNFIRNHNLPSIDK